MAPFGEAQYDSGPPPPSRQRSRRPQTDFGSTYVQWMRHRVAPGRRPKGERERPAASYIIDMLPPAARHENPADTIPSKHLHSSLNKIKHPINLVRWTPEGRRLLTGSSSGEFTLWNGMGFNFETIMQAHDHAIRAASWSYSNDWLLSADHDGVLKYWQPNFNNVKVIQAHDSPVRDLAFSPTDTKFVTASDDATLKVWDFAGGVEESTITGHGWDVKTVDWHPTKGLLVSGSKDHQVKLWDPRTSRCLTTLHGHKNAISKTAFEPIRGQMLATCAKDPIARIFDLRMMRDVLLLRGHDRDIATLTWHPIHPQMLSTGGGDGSLHHYILDEPNTPSDTTIAATTSPYDTPDPANAPAQTIHPAHRVPHAHEYAIWSLDWHPLGHILASGSNDRITRFWARARPGDAECLSDRYHLGDASSESPTAHWNRRPRNANATQHAADDDQQGDEDDADALVDQKMPARPVAPSLPGIAAKLDGTGVGGAQSNVPGLPGMGSALPPPPPPPQGQIPDLARLTQFFGGAAGAPGTESYSYTPPGTTDPRFPQAVAGLPGMSAAFNGGGPAAVLAGLQQQYNGVQDGAAPTARKRAPLPSQHESMMEEMRRSGGGGRR